MRLPPRSRPGGESMPVHEVLIARERSGTPRIRARSVRDGYYGLGFMHATDRLFQMFGVRALARGRLSEAFGDTEDLIASDRRARAGRLHQISNEDFAGLGEAGMVALNAYCAGANDVIEHGHQPFELRLTGNRTEPFTPEDILAGLRAISYFRLGGSQGAMELAIARALAADPGTFAAWSRLFAPVGEGYRAADYFRLVVEDGTLPPDQSSEEERGGSNSWAVAGTLTASGQPILCNDPHQDISCLPAVWYEAVLETPELWLMGATIPGGPVFASGWNRNLSWGVTFATADEEDLFVEECRDGRFLRDGLWYPFEVRQEELRIRSGKVLSAGFYENENGCLAGNPYIAGRYLVRRWGGTAKIAGSSMKGILALNAARDLDEGLEAIGSIRLPSLNWVLCDRFGHIGQRMNGAIPERIGDVSGLLPIPAWRSDVGWNGLCDPSRFPSERDPGSGVVVMANQRVGGAAFPQTMAASSDRADRIRQLLQAGHRQLGGALTESDMVQIQADVYSLRADRVIGFLGKHLGSHPLGRRLLAWDRHMERNSREATAFSRFCHGLLLATTRGVLFPPETLTVAEASPFFGINFRTIEEAWIEARPPFDTVNWGNIVPRVLDEIGFDHPPWGADPIIMKHVLIGSTPAGRLLQAGPYQARGDGSTVHQGSRFGRRARAIGPSYRLIVDFAEEVAFTALPGGASGRPLSSYYRRGINDWAAGRYRQLRPRES